nr:MAG TPA: hypothetical protein [Caudoviricetes sp.]
MHPVPAHRHLINRTVQENSPLSCEGSPRRGSPVKYRRRSESMGTSNQPLGMSVL